MTTKKRRKKRPQRRKAQPPVNAVESADRASTPPPGAPASRPLFTNAAIFGAIGALVGAGAGWFLRDARAEDKPAVSAPATTANATCADWEQKICEGLGKTSGDCKQARAASQMMPDTACAIAMGDLDKTIAKLKEGRKVCDELAEKLCGDLGKGSKATCDMVKNRMAAMPTEVCKERQQNYPLLLNQLKQMANPALRRKRPPRRPAHGPGDGHGHGHGHGPGDGHAH